MQLFEAALSLLNRNVVNLLPHLRLLIGCQHRKYLLAKRASGLTIRRGAEGMSLRILIEQALNLVVLLIAEIDPGEQLRPPAVDVAVSARRRSARLRLPLSGLVALLSGGPERQRQDPQERDWDEEFHWLHSIGTARARV